MREGDFQFEGPVVEWRGPAPFYFVAIPAEESADIKALFPRDRRYFLPLRGVVRNSAGIELDQVVAVRLSVGGQ